MVSVLSCTEDGQTAGSSKESGTTSCFPEKEEWTGSGIEYSCAVTPQVRQTGNRLSGLAGTAYASLLT